jgi:hypothetical protein
MNNKPYPNKKQHGGKPWLKPVDAGTSAIIDSAKNYMENVVGAKKDELQEVRLNLNQITPDNLGKKFKELRKLLVGDRKTINEEGFELDPDFEIDEEKLKIVVNTIFRKAQNEHIYSKFYSDLCKNIVSLELQCKGEKPGAMSKSNFRKMLLEACKNKFLENFEAQKSKEDAKKEAEEKEVKFDEMEFLENSLKLKHTLIGNMDFVGELYLSNILRDGIAQNILTNLLTDVARITDDTIEAALRFINKIGKTLEDKHQKQDLSKQKFSVDEYETIMSTFKKLMDAEDEKAPSTRIKMLIKNMIENRESGWSKQEKTNTKIKTKKQVEAEEFSKL